MAITTDCADGVWIFREQIRRQCGGPIGRPHSLQWRMLRGVCGRLRSVVTLDTGDRSGALSVAVLRRVSKMIERDWTKFRFLSQYVNVLRLLRILDRKSTV